MITVASCDPECVTIQNNNAPAVRTPHNPVRILMASGCGPRGKLVSVVSVIHVSFQ
jgi:hypothetical protein